jgi:hypothetical protein
MDSENTIHGQTSPTINAKKMQVQFGNTFHLYVKAFYGVLQSKLCNTTGKFQWLQNSSETNGDNLNKKREYLKKKFNELETNSKNKYIRNLYRGINEFKKGYQPRANLVKDENGDLLADSHKILNRWKNSVSY